MHQFDVVSDHIFLDEVVVHLPLDVWTVVEDIQGDLVGGGQVRTEGDLVVKVVERSDAESQGMEYLVLDFPPGLLFFFIQTISMEVDRLGSSLSPDRGPTILLDRREAEQENERIFSRSLITTH